MLSNQTLSVLKMGWRAQASNAKEEKSTVSRTASCKREKNEVAGRAHGYQHLACLPCAQCKGSELGSVSE